MPVLCRGSASGNLRVISLLQRQQTPVPAIVLGVAVAAAQPIQSPASAARAQLSPQYFAVSSRGTW